MIGNDGMPPRQDDESGELLDDLESIKDLLDDEDIPTLDPEAAVDVPLLDDTVAEQTGEEKGGETRSGPGMPDDAFKTLLGDAWQESVDQLFAEARASIERNSQDWLPEDTDNLAAALKVRIDRSVKAWLAETLQANIGLLRERIVTELSEELLGHMQQKFNLPESEKDRDTNG